MPMELPLKNIVLAYGVKVERVRYRRTCICTAGIVKVPCIRQTCIGGVALALIGKGKFVRIDTLKAICNRKF